MNFGVFALSLIAVASANAAYADFRCRIDLMSLGGSVVESFWWEGREEEETCEEARTLCLDHRERVGLVGQSHCVKAEVLVTSPRPPQPTPQPTPRPTPRPTPQPPVPPSGGPVGNSFTVRCGSENPVFIQCVIRTPRAIVGVDLVSQEGNLCVEDSTFGFERGMIWTNNGCRGVFRVLLER